HVLTIQTPASAHIRSLAANVVATHVSHRRIESFIDGKSTHSRGPQILIVSEGAGIRDRPSRDVPIIDNRCERISSKISSQPVQRIGTEGPIRLRGRICIGNNPADVGAPSEIPANPRRAQIRAGRACARTLLGLSGEKPEIEARSLSGETGPADDRHGLIAGRQSNAAAEEKLRVLADAKIEQRSILEKELALFREEQ